MGRTIMVVLALGAVWAGRAEGQSSIGVSAVIVEPVTAEPVHVEVRASARGLSVERIGMPASAGTMLLRRSYVATKEKPAAVVRLLPPGASVQVEGTRSLVITRVIAANS